MHNVSHKRKIHLSVSMIGNTHPDEHLGDQPGNRPSASVAAGEEARDGDEQDGADGGGGEAAEDAVELNSQAGENPAADDGADQADNDIGEAAKPAAARECSGEPTGDEADDDPVEPTAVDVNVVVV